MPFRIARLGGGLDALRDDDVLTSALRGPVGVSTAVTAGALLVVAALVDRRAARWVSLLFAVVALAGFSIEGHTRATDRRWVMVGSDVVHLVAGSIWLGGIVALVVAFRASIDAPSLAATVRRFSDAALVAVGVVAVTGVAMAWIILPTAGELTSTGYGLALILKVALVRRRHCPWSVQPVSPGAGRRRARGAGGRGRRRPLRGRWLGKVVVAELVLLVAAVGVTAVMVTRSPLSSAVAASAAAPESQTVTVPLGDAGTADVTITPGRRRLQRRRCRSSAITQGRIVNPYEAPELEFSLPALDVGPLQPEVLPLGIGRYQATADLGFAGSWDLSIRVRLDEFESVAGATTVAIE